MCRQFDEDEDETDSPVAGVVRVILVFIGVIACFGIIPTVLMWLSKHHWL